MRGPLVRGLAGRADRASREPLPPDQDPPRPSGSLVPRGPRAEEEPASDRPGAEAEDPEARAPSGRPELRVPNPRPPAERVPCSGRHPSPRCGRPPSERSGRAAPGRPERPPSVRSVRAPAARSGRASPERSARPSSVCEKRRAAGRSGRPDREDGEPPLRAGRDARRSPEAPDPSGAPRPPPGRPVPPDAAPPRGRRSSLIVPPGTNPRTRQKAEKGRPEGDPFLKNVRRRPTLPHRSQCSTIGAEGLSFRVRNGAGRFPFAMTAVTLWRCQSVPDRISGTAQWTQAQQKLMMCQVIGLLVPVSFMCLWSTLPRPAYQPSVLAGGLSG